LLLHLISAAFNVRLRSFSKNPAYVIHVRNAETCAVEEQMRISFAELILVVQQKWQWFSSPQLLPRNCSQKCRNRRASINLGQEHWTMHVSRVGTPTLEPDGIHSDRSELPEFGIFDIGK
jgi:hypothetical protein